MNTTLPTTLACSLAGGAALLALAACGSTQTQGSPAPTVATTSPTSTLSEPSEPAPAHHKALKVPPPGEPNQVCGVVTQDDADQLVQSGQSFALVDVTITKPAGSWSNNQRLLPVDSAAVLAGSLPNGQLTTLVEGAPQDQPGFIPPGEYAVLVTDGGAASTYTVSDGVSGTFDIDNGQLTQRCPGEQTGDYIKATTGVSDQAQLVSMFTTAFASD